MEGKGTALQPGALGGSCLGVMHAPSAKATVTQLEVDEDFGNNFDARSKALTEHLVPCITATIGGSSICGVNPKVVGSVFNDLVDFDRKMVSAAIESWSTASFLPNEFEGHLVTKMEHLATLPQVLKNGQQGTSERHPGAFVSQVNNMETERATRDGSHEEVTQCVVDFINAPLEKKVPFEFQVSADFERSIPVKSGGLCSFLVECHGLKVKIKFDVALGVVKRAFVAACEERRHAEKNIKKAMI